jgi:hypothetical protein
MKTLLRRFWFPRTVGLGYGVTAYSVEDARQLLRQAGLSGEGESVVEDVDIRTLDQGHVIPNMRPPNLRGVWFPMF